MPGDGHKIKPCGVPISHGFLVFHRQPCFRKMRKVQLPFMWPFKRRSLDTAEKPPPEPTGQERLLTAFLETERLRLEKSAELEARKHDAEMKRYELELRELERIGEEKRKQQVFNERVREQRRENLAKGREVNRQKKAAAAAGAKAPTYGCEECQAITEGRSPAHASDLIRHATEKHTERFMTN